MIGCVRKQRIIALYFESETVIKFYNLEAWFYNISTECEDLLEEHIIGQYHKFLSDKTVVINMSRNGQLRTYVILLEIVLLNTNSNKA